MGEMRDLLPLSATIEGDQSPMLLLFVLGFQHPHFSNREIMRLLQEKLSLE